MRTVAQSFVRRFESGDCLLVLDGRKRVQELFKAVAPFQVVDQVSEGNTRIDEHWDAAKNLRVAVNGGGAGHVSLLSSSYRHRGKPITVAGRAGPAHVHQHLRTEDEGYGAILAIDPVTGDRKWEYTMVDFTDAGMMS